MNPKLIASCKNKDCTHKFESQGEPKGAPSSDKPKGDPVVLLTCPQCSETQEIPVKAFKAPEVKKEPAAPAE